MWKINEKTKNNKFLSQKKIFLNKEGNAYFLNKI